MHRILPRAALAVLGATCAGTAASTAVGATAAPPPAFVVAAAKREATGLGDPRPTAAQYVLARRRAAVRAGSGASVRSNELVYLIVLTGDFSTGPVGPAPGRAVSGRFATEVLDATTGRDLDFGIGQSRIRIRGLGLVGDLIPYLDGAALPACGAPDLRATAALQGATGSQLGGVGISNRSNLACSLPLKPLVRLSWRGRRLPVATTPFPPGWLARMNPSWGRPVTVLRPGARAQLVLQWFNWCGPTPWGRGRGFRLTVSAGAYGQPITVRATTSERVLAPYCNLPAHTGAGSTLRVSPFVAF